MPEQNSNHDQMQEIQEAIKLRRTLNSNEGYSDPNHWSISNIVKSQERLLVEEVDINIAPTSVLEQIIKQFNELKRLSVQEFTDRKIGPSTFEQQQVAMHEAMSFLYDIIQERYKYAQLEPDKWSELIVSHTSLPQTTEKEQLEVVRKVTEKRWKCDEKIVEFDAFLRLKKLKENN